MTQLPPPPPPPGGPPVGGSAPQSGWGPPGASPAGWGPPQAAPRRNTNVPLLVAGLVAVVAVLVLVVALASDGGGDGEVPGADETAGGGNAGSTPTLPEGPAASGGSDEESLPEGVRRDPDAPGGLAPEPDGNENLPTHVVVGVFDALNGGDCEQARDFFTADGWTRLFGGASEEDAMAACQSESGPTDVSITSAEISGVLLEPSSDLVAEGMQPNTATVDAVLSDGSELTFWLIMEDGLWKIYG
jgi:hypothetical protein